VPRKVTNLAFVAYVAASSIPLAMDTARGRQERRQKGHLLIALVWATVVADLVSSCALEDVIRVVRVAELTQIVPVTGADKRMAYGDVNQQISLLRHADVADFKIGAVAALTREHPLVIGGKTGGMTDALQRLQNMLVCAGPICIMMDVRERSEGRVVGEPEELMEESNIVLLRDILRGAWRISAVCRPRAAHLAPHRRGFLPPSVVPLVWESNPTLQGGWCKTQPPAHRGDLIPHQGIWSCVAHLGRGYP
jgi:hypothetical protein